MAGCDESAFTLGIEGIATTLPWGEQGAVIAPCVGCNVVDRTYSLQATHVKTDMAIHHLVVDVQLTTSTAFLVVVCLPVRVGLQRQQVLQVDSEAIAGCDAQHQGPRTLVRP
ncbi:hypothetical protein D3C81_1799610 [compost metagenome]